jgi:biopolymer transport protein ExbD
MAIAVGANRGIIMEVNVVPLIDVLLVLLVIFMIIPHRQHGLPVELPQPASETRVDPLPETIVVQVKADGSLRLNQRAIEWTKLPKRLEEIFGARANHTAFVQGDGETEFQIVARS